MLKTHEVAYAYIVIGYQRSILCDDSIKFFLQSVHSKIFFMLGSESSSMPEEYMNTKRDRNSKVYRDVISMNQAQYGSSVRTSLDTSNHIPFKVPALNLPTPIITGRSFDSKQVLSNNGKSSSNTPSIATASYGNGGSSSPEIPPFIFRRVPRLEQPLVNIQALSMELEAQKPSAVEGWLDSMFNSGDKIYEEVIRKLQQQVLVLESRINLLEMNLDTAEIEIEYWRDAYTSRAFSKDNQHQPSNPVISPSKAGRKITRPCWQLAISKFVGSGDQFTMMKTLFHWRQYVLTRNSDSPM
jgi:hypothetical protein